MAVVSAFKLSFRSLLFYRRAHIAVILGTAISTMVITGTLMVGDSVESSLEETVRLRLGNTSYILSGKDRNFRAALANEISRDLALTVSPILQLNGIASSGGGALRVNQVEITGITEEFAGFIPGQTGFNLPAENEAYISENLASRLELSTGDYFLLRFDKISQVPKNAPFVSDDDNQVSLRLKVGKILGSEQLGRFNLKASQTAPYNVFLPLSFLNEKSGEKGMGLTGKANRLLFATNPGIGENDILEAVKKNWTLADMALEISAGERRSEWELSSDRVFIEPVAAGAAEKMDPASEKILTYFVNGFNCGSNQTPYSFISAGPFRYRDQSLDPGEIFINAWLAEDLSAKPGDSVKLTYFVIGTLRNLVEKSAWFRVKGIVPMQGEFADRGLMPDIPGLTDAGNCRDWQTSIPIDLKKIRDKDEHYWNEWKGTPKAFINYIDGKKLWENRFGSCTAIRFSPDFSSREDLEQALTTRLGPGKFGISIIPVKEEGMTAAHGGVDFSQLFMGLSFFLLIGGITLLALLYNLHLERRMEEAGTLKAMGYPNRLVRKILLTEGFLIAIPGVLIGGLLAIFYNKGVFIGLNTVWSEIVRTSVLEEKIKISTLLTGMGTGLVLSGLTMFLNIYRKLKSETAGLQRGIQESRSARVIRWIYPGAWISGFAAMGLLLFEIISGGSLDPGLFFAAGGLLLLSFLFFAIVFILRERTAGSEKISLSSLAYDNLYRKPSRSIRIVLLFAVGTFVIVSTGLNQKDLYSGSQDPRSGTGGFLFYGETTLPVLVDLNTDAGRVKFGLEDPLTFIQMRKNEGDDASCLNLNRVSQPRILGFQAEKLEGRFSFVKHTGDLDKDRPWSSLKRILPGGVIPAVADQTVIQWGLGLKVGDTLTYQDERGETLKLKLVGGLANSIFQGNVLIDESFFLEHFPSSSGSYVMLVEGKFTESDKISNELERGFRNQGLELITAASRLASFNEVENTYLSIFLLLGGLGMILGTIGLGVSLARNMIDRQQELGLLKAIGFPDRAILTMISWEHLVLLVTGTVIGAVSAFTAIIPSLLSAFVDASWQTAFIIILIILLNGFLWILLVARHNLKKSLIGSLRSE
jgi:putative ABC transport system permease protein